MPPTKRRTGDFGAREAGHLKQAFHACSESCSSSSIVRERLRSSSGGLAAAVAADGGETIKTTGDGVLGLFPRPAHRRSGTQPRWTRRPLAARIMSRAEASEILVSRTV